MRTLRLAPERVALADMRLRHLRCRADHIEHRMRFRAPDKVGMHPPRVGIGEIGRGDDPAALHQVGDLGRVLEHLLRRRRRRADRRESDGAAPPGDDVAPLRRRLAGRHDDDPRHLLRLVESVERAVADLPRRGALRGALDRCFGDELATRRCIGFRGRPCRNKRDCGHDKADKSEPAAAKSAAVWIKLHVSVPSSYRSAALNNCARPMFRPHCGLNADKVKHASETPGHKGDARGGER